MNLETFKQLSFKKKLQWILQYYGIWIIVSIIAAYVLFVFVKSVFFPEPISDICIIVYSDDYDRNDIPKMESEIANLTGNTTSVEIYNISDVYGSQSFSIKLVSDQIDLVIAPNAQINDMLANGYLESITPMNNNDLSIGVPVNARKANNLDKAISYLLENK